MSGSIKVGGNTIATHTGAQGAGEVTLGTNLRLPASGGIQDSSGNNILTESGGTITLTADETNVGSNALVVDSSGKVGVGTNSPGYILDIQHTSGNLGGLQVKNNATGNVLYGGSYTEFKIQSDSADFRITQVGGSGYLYGGPASINLVQGSNAPMTFSTNNIERMRIDSNGDLLFNSGYGSVATAYGCRAWVNFNPQGTIAIRSSGNVSSLADNGTGDYTVNFSTAMPDSNYCAVVFNGITSSLHAIPTRGGSIVAYSNSAIRVSSYYMNSSSIGVEEDGNYSMISIFR